jgi:hypothetical protein
VNRVILTLDRLVVQILVPITAGVAGDAIGLSAIASTPVADLLGGDCPTSSMCFVLTQNEIIPVSPGGAGP